MPKNNGPQGRRQEKLWELEVKQEKRKKRLLIMTPILVVLIIIGLFVIGDNEISSAVIQKEHSVVSLYDTLADETVYIYDGSVLPQRISGKTLGAQGTLDGTALCELSEAGEVVLANSTGVKIVAEGVADFAFATGGSKIIYCEADGDPVSIYDVSSGAVSTVTGTKWLSGLRISPDGGSFAYTDGVLLYCATPDSVVYTQEGLLPLSISNGGEYLYAYSESEKALFCLEPPGAALRLVENVDINGTFITNATNTQILCQTGAGPYIVSEGKEATKFGGSGTSAPAVEWDSYAVTPEGMPGVLNTASLYGLVYNSYDEGSYVLYGVSLEGASKKQREGSDTPFLVRADNRTAYIVKDGELCFIRNSSKGGDSTTLDAGVSMDGLHSDADGERLYYLNNFSQLKVIKERKNPKLIAENVSSLAAAYDGGAYYVGDFNGETGTLYKYDGKTTGAALMEGVHAVQVLPGSVVCYLPVGDGLFDLYASPDGESFTLAAGNVVYD